MTCPNCFTECPDGQTVCGECGRPLPIGQLAPAAADNEPGHGTDCPCLTCYFAGLEGDITNV